MDSSNSIITSLTLYTSVRCVGLDELHRITTLLPVCFSSPLVFLSFWDSTCTKHYSTGFTLERAFIWLVSRHWWPQHAEVKPKWMCEVNRPVDFRLDSWQYRPAVCQSTQTAGWPGPTSSRQKLFSLWPSSQSGGSSCCRIVTSFTLPTFGCQQVHCCTGPQCHYLLYW